MWIPKTSTNLSSLLIVAEIKQFFRFFFFDVQQIANNLSASRLFRGSKNKCNFRYNADDLHIWWHFFLFKSNSYLL